MQQSNDSTNKEEQLGAAGAPLALAADRGGAIDPRLVTRGESYDLKTNAVVNADAAITDWISCSFKISSDLETQTEFFHDVRAILGLTDIRVIERGYGHLGWKRSFIFEGTDVIFATGGQNERSFIQFPGKACALISKNNWKNLVWLFGKILGARITRWDGAVDDYVGKHGIDWALQEHKLGNFSTAGNKPKLKQIGNFIEPDGTGRTLNFGSRENGKLLRIYEKGKQLKDPNCPWVRWELELHNTDRIIPWDVISNPGPYVAGSYKATEWICDSACRVKTFRKHSEISLDASIRNAKNSCGPLVNYMLETGCSADEVVEQLRRPGKPRRLEIPEPPEMHEADTNSKDDS